jgi:hypothetical protein
MIRNVQLIDQLIDFKDVLIGCVAADHAVHVGTSKLVDLFEDTVFCRLAHLCSLIDDIDADDLEEL